MVNQASTKFVLLAAPRTGSNLLVTLINSHREVRCQFEAFDPERIIVTDSMEKRLPDIQMRNSNPIGFLHKLYALYPEYIAVGFKYFCGHDQRVLDYVLKNKSIKKIILTRDNRLYTYSSLKIAMTTGQWGTMNVREVKHAQVMFDKYEFMRYCHLLDDYYRLIESVTTGTSQECFRIEYDNLLDDDLHAELISFLGVTEGVVLASRTVRQNPESLRDRFLNYSELASALKGTVYEKWVV